MGNVRSVLYPVYATPSPLAFNSSFEGNDIAGYGNDYSSLTKAYSPGFTIPIGYGTKALALQFPNKSIGVAYKRVVKAGDHLTGASIQAYLTATGIKAGYLVAGFFDANGEPLYYDQDRLQPAKDSSSESGISMQWNALTVNNLTVPDILYNNRGNIAETVYLNVFVHQMALSGNAEIYYDQLQISIEYAPLVDKNSLQGVVSYTDYYPYGLPMGNQYISGVRYRYGYQGQNAEVDPETGYNAFELRMYDPAIGRWLSVDPSRQYPNPYLGNGNNPVTITDPDGGCDDPPCEGANTTASVANNLMIGISKYYSDMKNGFSNMSLTSFGKGVGEFALGTPYRAYKDYSLAYEITNIAWNGDYDLAANKLGYRLGAHSFEVGTTLVTAGTGSYVSNASNKIIGFAQSTGTRGHAFLSQSTAYFYALNPYVRRVTMDLGYKRLLGGGSFKYGPRPDVGVLFKNNRIKAIEIASKTDDLAKLTMRNYNYQRYKIGIADPSVKVFTGARLINKIFPK